MQASSLLILAMSSPESSKGTSAPAVAPTTVPAPAKIDFSKLQANSRLSKAEIKNISDAYEADRTALVEATKNELKQFISSDYGAANYGALGGKSGIIALQQKLGLNPKGTFDSETFVAIIDYQKANHLMIDGIAGPQTQSSLGIVATAVSHATPGGKPERRGSHSANAPSSAANSTGVAEAAPVFSASASLRKYGMLVAGIESQIRETNASKQQNTGTIAGIGDAIGGATGWFTTGKEIYQGAIDRTKDQAKTIHAKLLADFNGKPATEKEQIEMIALVNRLSAISGAKLEDVSFVTAYINELKNSPEALVSTGYALKGMGEGAFDVVKGIWDVSVFLAKLVKEENRIQAGKQWDEIKGAVKASGGAWPLAKKAFATEIDRVSKLPPHEQSEAIGKIAGNVIAMLALGGAVSHLSKARNAATVTQTALTEASNVAQLAGKTEQAAALATQAAREGMKRTAYAVGTMALGGPAETAIGASLSRSFSTLSQTLRGGLSLPNKLKAVEAGLRDFDEVMKTEKNPTRVAALAQAREALHAEREKLVQAIDPTVMEAAKQSARPKAVPKSEKPADVAAPVESSAKQLGYTPSASAEGTAPKKAAPKPSAKAEGRSTEKPGTRTAEKPEPKTEPKDAPNSREGKPVETWFSYDSSKTLAQNQKAFAKAYHTDKIAGLPDEAKQYAHEMMATYTQYTKGLKDARTVLIASEEKLEELRKMAKPNPQQIQTAERELAHAKQALTRAENQVESYIKNPGAYVKKPKPRPEAGANGPESEVKPDFMPRFNEQLRAMEKLFDISKSQKGSERYFYVQFVNETLVDIKVAINKGVISAEEGIMMLSSMRQDNRAFIRDYASKGGRTLEDILKARKTAWEAANPSRAANSTESAANAAPKSINEMLRGFAEELQNIVEMVGKNFSELQKQLNEVRQLLQENARGNWGKISKQLESIAQMVRDLPNMSAKMKEDILAKLQTISERYFARKTQNGMPNGAEKVEPTMGGKAKNAANDSRFASDEIMEHINKSGMNLPRTDGTFTSLKSGEYAVYDLGNDSYRVTWNELGRPMVKNVKKKDLWGANPHFAAGARKAA